jgi:hypothetical protein
MVKIDGFRRAGMCYIKIISFSIAGMCLGQNRQFQHGWNVALTKSSVSAWLESWSKLVLKGLWSEKSVSSFSKRSKWYKILAKTKLEYKFV